MPSVWREWEIVWYVLVIIWLPVTSVPRYYLTERMPAPSVGKILQKWSKFIIHRRRQKKIKVTWLKKVGYLLEDIFISLFSLFIIYKVKSWKFKLIIFVVLRKIHGTLAFSLCTLTPKVQCVFHQNHVVWQMKIKKLSTE